MGNRDWFWEEHSTRKPFPVQMEQNDDFPNVGKLYQCSPG